MAGKVVSSSGEVVAGANIILKAKIINDREMSLDSSPMGAATDLSGEYFILNISPGSYVVECSMLGYQTVIKRPVKVSVDRTTSLDFTLSEEVLEGETVVVTADRPMVVKDLTSTTAKVAGETIEDLPVETFEEVLSLQTGITTGIAGGIHIRGGRSSEIKYYVDGIAVSNPFNNSLAVPVENNSIQELEVISGTFNAEYGQAQSGIVNIVTKEGTDQFTGNISVYTGDFLSNRTDVFWNIDDINPLSQKYLEGSVSGPLIGSKLKFFISGRLTDHENWLYGRRVFLPIDSSSFASTNPDKWYIERSGDSEYVSMNPSKSLSGQMKLSYQFTPAFKMSYSLMTNYGDYKYYSGFYRLNPDSRRTHYTAAYNHMINIAQTVTPRMFYTVKLALYENDYESYAKKDPYNPAYRAIFGRNRQPDGMFSTGGIDPGHTYKNSTTYALRADFNWQVNKSNLIKIGTEYRTHVLDYESFAINVDPLAYNDWERRIPPISSTNHNRYQKKPLEFAAYIQDKIEISDLIVNLGLRFDYFDPKSNIPADFRDPANKLYPVPLEEAYREVDPKTQLSPRLGLAFPITETGVIHAAYGQFFQIPEFERLYENPEYEVSGYYGSYIGNADLEAQRTDMYELGLQQQLAWFLAVDVTGYYRNIRNLMGSELYETYRSDLLYGRYANSTHGSVRGVAISTRIRLPEFGLTGDVNYTYQTAKGIASDPKQEFYDARGRNEAAIKLKPLDWDLRHTFNAFLNYAAENYGGSIILKMNSGYPFSPEGFTELRNAGRFKGDLFADVSLYKRFKVYENTRLEFFVKVINVFDRYRIDLLPTIFPIDNQAHQDNGLDRFNTLYEYNLDPAIQPTPREIRIGTKIEF